MEHILFITNFPSPYKVDFYEELSKYMGLTVLYFDTVENQKTRSKAWFSEETGNYRSVQLKKKVASLKDENLCVDVIDWLKKPYDKIVVCGYSSPTAMLAMAYLRMKKIPFYIQVDGGLVRPDSRLKYWYKKLLVSSGSFWLSSSPGTTDYLVHYGAKREAIYEYPFTSLREKDILREIPSQETKAELRRKLGMAERKIVLYVGRFLPGKGMEDLLYGAISLEKDTGVYFVGGEPSEAQKDYCREHTLTNVHFVGFTPKEALAEYYQAADVFVLPTKSDVWGLVINEAMSFGLPVITTNMCVAGMALVQEGVNGYIVPVDDRDALADRIRQLLRQDYRQMGAAALETIRPYTIENMAKAHVRIFREQEN